MEYSMTLGITEKSTLDVRYSNREAADYLGLKAATLNKWRVFGQGPPFIKVGHLVRYRKADLDAFLQSRLRRSTSDSGDALLRQHRRQPSTSPDAI